jgi:hypothetical protein
MRRETTLCSSSPTYTESWFVATAQETSRFRAFGRIFAAPPNVGTHNRIIEKR